MPTPMPSAQALQSELEHVRMQLETEFQLDAGLWGEIEDKTESIDDISMRQVRLPVSMAQPGFFNQFNPDGGDLGVGNGLITDAFLISPTFLEQGIGWTWLTEIAASGGKKSVKDIVKELHDKAMMMFKSNLDATLAASDGSGFLDTVVSTANGQITVNNANLFQDQGIYQGYSAGGAFQGTFQVSYTDATNNLLNVQGGIPGAIGAGTKLYISGSSTTASSCLMGIPGLQQQSNTGVFQGINRVTYPGRLTTPQIGSGSPGSLTQLIARRMLNAIKTAMGKEYTKNQRIVFHGNLDQATAWELVGVAVSQVIQNQLKGTSSQDMLQKEMPQTIAGREYFENIHGVPGRLDALCLDCWGKVTIQEIDYYSNNGNTVFPQYGGSGGIATSSLAYLVWGGQVFNMNTRAGSYATGLTQPYTLGK